MDFNQAITKLGSFYQQVSVLSQQLGGDAEIFRVFRLEAGEQLTLKAIDTYDYIYALKGRAVLRPDSSAEISLQADDPEQQRFMIPACVEAIRIEASEQVLLYQIAGEDLDYLVALNEVVELLRPGDEETRRRAYLVRNSRAFHRLPIEAVAEAVQHLERVAVTKGQEVVRQGEPGDAYYIIEDGEAQVWQTDLYDKEPQLVNELSAGDAFGEEALVMGGPRNATVVMTRGGHLLVLGKKDFDKLVKKRMVEWIDGAMAKSLLEAGYQLLDVRYEEEYQDSHIPDSILIPLNQLRKRYTELDSRKPYLAYCKGGKRSAVACLLLRQRGYEAVSLSGGIREWPYEVASFC
jgi:rhodanese-related sulfurtransferase